MQSGVAPIAIHGSLFPEQQSDGWVDDQAVGPGRNASDWAISVVHEGVYGLSFKAASLCDDSAGGDRVDGLAVLRGGKVLGSDRHGGVFSGRYHYDATAGVAVIDVRLAIPPNGVLLTGLEAGPDGLMVAISGRFAPPKPVSTAAIDVHGETVLVELRFVGPLAGSSVP